MVMRLGIFARFLMFSHTFMHLMTINIAISRGRRLPRYFCVFEHLLNAVSCGAVAVARDQPRQRGPSRPLLRSSALLLASRDGGD